MIYFRVDGKVIPKQRPRIYRGHAFTPKETKEYEAKVKKSYLTQVSDKKSLYEENMPIVAFITIHQQIPKSFSKKKVQLALDEALVPTTHNGDIDNFCKSILDGLNGVAFQDDCQIVRMHARKVYALEPYAEVTLMSLDEYRLLDHKSEVKLP